jgi:hypothetical protein
MKNWPASIIFEVAGSMFGRAFLFFGFGLIGVIISISCIKGEILFPENIIPIIGLVIMASIVLPISAAFLALELILAVIFIRSEGKLWYLVCITGLTAAHTFCLTNGIG